MLKNISKLFTWIKYRIKHKLEHFKPSCLIETFKKHGIALLVIIIVLEIIEDIMFPLLFIYHILQQKLQPYAARGMLR